MGPDTPLAIWAEKEFRHCAAKLAQCISATGLVKERPGFGTTVRPVKGSGQPMWEGSVL